MLLVGNDVTGQVDSKIPPTSSFIHTLPDEILIEILYWICGVGIPSQSLALVCKRWRLVLLETADFWRNTVAEIVLNHEADFRARQMRRRLELSREALLDVIMRRSCDNGKPDTTDILFDILSSIPFDRWTSVVLGGASGYISQAVCDKFNGSFTSLKSLHFSDYPGPGYGRFYKFLAQAPSTVERIVVVRNLPNSLMTSSFLQNVKEAKLYTSDYDTVMRLGKVEKIGMMYPGMLNSPTLPALPITVTLWKIRPRSPSLLDFAAVESLEIRIIATSDEYNSVQLPSLTTLVIPCGLSYCRRFIAPKLSSLTIGQDLRGTSTENLEAENRKILDIFKNNSSQFEFAPTSLHINVPLAFQAMLAILSTWSQIQHLGLDVSSNKYSSWEDIFSRAFQRKEGRLCPNLITLKLQTKWSGEDQQQWGQTVEKLFLQREHGSLGLISWTYGEDSKGKSIVRREDIFPRSYWM